MFDRSRRRSLNTIEFDLRENNTGRFPRGLSLMLRSVSAWLYERDAFEPLRFAGPLAQLKGRIEAGEDVWRPLLKKFLLENKHRVTVELQPDSQARRKPCSILAPSAQTPREFPFPFRPFCHLAPKQTPGGLDGLG